MQRSCIVKHYMAPVTFSWSRKLEQSNCKLWLCSEMTLASGPTLPPGNVCRAKTLICSVIRGDSLCLLFMEKMNSGFRAFCWGLQGNNKHLSPQLISLLLSSKLINPNWFVLERDYRRSSHPNPQRVFSVQTTHSLTGSAVTHACIHTDTHTL